MTIQDRRTRKGPRQSATPPAGVRMRQRAAKALSRPDYFSIQVAWAGLLYRLERLATFRGETQR